MSTIETRRVVRPAGRSDPRDGAAGDGPLPASAKARGGLSRSTQPRVSAGEEMAQARLVLSSAKGEVQRIFGAARLGRAADLEAVAPLVDEVAGSLARNSSALIGLARLKRKDEYSYIHSVAVCALMLNLSRTIGLDEAAAREAATAGLLHDIGKMTVPDEVLSKPGALTGGEYRLMQSHTTRGWSYLKDLSGIADAALDVCLHHHEKIDGSGYPHRLAGDEISLYARMGAICDVYDAMTSTRPYKVAHDAADALAQMFGWEGRFDRELMAAFVRSVGIYPIGTLVRLRSGRLAVVCDQNNADLTRPVVRPFFSIAQDRPLVAPLLDLGAAEDAIERREAPRDWGLAEWDREWPRLVEGKTI